MEAIIPIRCESCRRTLSDEQIMNGKYKRVSWQAASGVPLMTLIMCNKCAQEQLGRIYHRQ